MQAIDLIRFLLYYHGIYHPDLSSDTLTHADVNVLFPEVKVCRETVTEKDLLSGDVIGVYDKSNRIVYYYNPRLDIDIPIVDVSTKQVEETYISIDDLDGLSKDELLKIRRKLRLNNQRKESNIITSMIRKIKRKEPKAYRKEKERILMKERMNNYD